jgi:hypothetical protein
MSVRGVGRGGKAGAAKGAAGASKASAASFGGKVDKAEAKHAVSGLVASAGAGEAAPVDAVTAQAVELIRQLKSGQLKSRDEATRKLVQDILKEKVRTQSKQLADKIMDQMKDDPRLSQSLDKLWQRAEEQD